MLNFRNALPKSVQVPDNEKKQIALLVCKAIDEMLYADNAHYDWKVTERLGDLLPMDYPVILLMNENFSTRLNKRLYLDDTDYKFANLTVAQFIDVVYASYNDLPLPDFKKPSFVQTFKRCFSINRQKTRE